MAAPNASLLSRRGRERFLRGFSCGQDRPKPPLPKKMRVLSPRGGLQCLSMSKASPRIRADELLAAKGLAESRSQARALILAGKVRTGPDTVVSKAGQLLPQDTVFLIEKPPRFVSRAGEKLEGFFEKFPFDIAGKATLDVGASTGGFTDFLLQHGAAQATCVDVGYGQLHARLRADPRVTNIEKLNARTLDTAELPRPRYDIVVIDVSFISLKRVLEPAWARLETGGILVALVKPQFEADRAEVSRGKGVIRDDALREKILADVTAFALARLEGATLVGQTPSPISGADGNREYLIGLRKAPASAPTSAA